MKLIGKTFEVTVFSRGVPLNQVLFTSCIDICLSCYLQVGTRCHLFTSWYMLSLRGHLFTSTRGHLFTSTRCHLFTSTRCLLFTSCYTLSLCGHLFTRVYNGLQVHVSPRSDVTFGNDVALHKTLHKNRLESVVIYY